MACTCILILQRMFAVGLLCPDLGDLGSWHAAVSRTVAFGCAGIALTVALLIIGDEILAGKVEDTNSSFLCRELYALGWRVVKVRPPDRLQTILHEPKD